MNFDKQSRYDEEIVSRVHREFGQMSQQRFNFENQWNEIAEYLIPDMRNTFTDGWMRSAGQKNTEKQIDSTASLALVRFGAIMDSLLTPRNNTWHALEASDPDLNKDRDVKIWFEDVNRRLFKARYSPSANFSSQNQMTYKQIGAFGNGPLFIDRYEGAGGGRGLRYKSIPLGEIYIKENHQGQVDGFVRVFYLTTRQAFQRWGEKLPEGIKGRLTTASEQMHKFFHYVGPREDFEPGRLGIKGKLYASYYVSSEGQALLQEGGYNTFPMPCSRYEQYPGEVYGRGPGGLVLPAIKTLNTEKRTVLKAGHRTADPVLLTHDDGIANFSMRPGALNPGGMTADGKPLVGTIPIGNVNIGKELMDDERAVINDVFLVRLFQVLLEDPKVMTATQVVEMANEKGILLSPTIAGQQSGYLGPTIDRELDVMAEEGMLPPMPPQLIEANGSYEVVYTSPFSKAARSQEVAGLMRSVETTLQVVQITQDPAPLDHYNWDIIIPAVSDIQSVPSDWMNSPRSVAFIRKQRAEAQQRQEQIQAAPAEAAMMKAEAVAGK